MNFKKAGAFALAVLAVTSLVGCGGMKGPVPPKEINVNTYKIERANTFINMEYPGSVVAMQEVPIRSRVTGNIVEKYVSGGEYVNKGQVLYKIDSRAYDSALAAAKAQSSQAHVAVDNAELDLHRYQVLAENDAIAKQVLDSQRAKTESAIETFKASQAQVKIAEDNVNDTVIKAPFAGTLGMDDVSVGTFIAAGQVPLVTIQSIDPVYVKFSMSEAQYLNYKKESANGLGELTLLLSDKSQYPLKGKVVEVSKNLDPSSGQILMKAQFDNPNQILLSGMFATVVTNSTEIKNAILVPTKALVQVLDKTFVMVVGEDNKIVQIPVEKGATQGYYTVVKGDLKDGQQIVVEGLTKIKAGSTVIPKLLTKEDIQKGE